MTKYYEYKRKKFEIDEIDNGLEVSKDGCTVKILRDPEAGGFMLTSSDGMDVLGRDESADEAFLMACDTILENLERQSENNATENKLTADLKALYDKL